MLRSIVLLALFAGALFTPQLAVAGPLEGLVGMAGELVDDVVGIMQVLLLGYGAYVGFLWYSGSPDAKRHTAFLFVGGAMLFGAPGIIDALRGRFGA